MVCNLVLCQADLKIRGTCRQMTVKLSAAFLTACHCFVYSCSERKPKESLVPVSFNVCFEKKFGTFSHPPSPTAPDKGKKEERRKENRRTAEGQKNVSRMPSCFKMLREKDNYFHFPFLLQPQAIHGREDIGWLKTVRDT